MAPNSLAVSINQKQKSGLTSVLTRGECLTKGECDIISIIRHYFLRKLSNFNILALDNVKTIVKVLLENLVQAKTLELRP